MLTIQEQKYFSALIDTYKSKGYNYYVLQTDRPGTTNYEYEFIIYFSKTKITCSSPTTFYIDDGIRIYIDSTLRNVNSNNNSYFSISNYSGTLNIQPAEFVYTNSAVGYDYNTSLILPDLQWGGGATYETTFFDQAFSYIVVGAFLVAFLFSLFSRK